MGFYVGQRVTRIRPPRKSGARTQMGVVYTIVGLDHRPNRVGLPSGIFLAGIEPYRARSGRLLGFDPCDWRAVVEPKTDISIFQAMLNPAQETVDVG